MLENTQSRSVYTMQKGGWFYVRCILIMIFGVLLLAPFESFIPEHIYMFLQMIMPYILISVMLIFTLHKHDIDIEGDGNFDLMNIFLTLPITFCIYPLTLLIVTVYSELIPNSAGGIDADMIPNLVRLGPVFGWIMMAVIPATVEEYVCRGLLYSVARKRGFVFATIVTSVCFSLLHMGLQQALYTLFLGVLLAIVREFTKSVYPCMLIHLWYNSLSVFAIYFGSEIVDNPEVSNTTEVSFLDTVLFLEILSVLLLIVLFFVLRFLAKYNCYVFDKTVDKTQSGLTKGFVIGYVICGILMILTL